MEERKQQLKKEIHELKLKLEPLQKELSDIYIKEVEDTNNKVDKAKLLEDKFILDELIYSAHDTCECGAGLAYPKKTSVHGAWNCGDILLGRALPKSDPNHKQHSGAMPFAFYEIKSEKQPSANGTTTRPKE